MWGTGGVPGEGSSVLSALQWEGAGLTGEVLRSEQTDPGGIGPAQARPCRPYQGLGFLCQKGLKS